MVHTINLFLLLLGYVFACFLAQNSSSLQLSSSHSIPNGDNPENLEVGNRIQFGNPPCYGTIRWIGHLPSITCTMAGVEVVSCEQFSICSRNKVQWLHNTLLIISTHIQLQTYINMKLQCTLPWLANKLLANHWSLLYLIHTSRLRKTINCNGCTDILEAYSMKNS